MNLPDPLFPYPGPTVVPCPYCGRGVGERCKDQRGNARFPVHAARRNDYAKWREEKREDKLRSEFRAVPEELEP